MKKKKIRELRLGVGSDIDTYPNTDFGNIVGYGGYRGNADTDMSRRMSVTNEDDDLEKLRRKSNKKKEKRKKKMKDKMLLDDYFFEEEKINEDVLGTLGHALKSFGKSVLGAIPGLDAVIGTMFIGSAALRIKKFSDDLGKHMQLEDGYFGKALKHDSDAYFKAVIKRAQQVPKEDREAVRKNFNKILDSFKEIIITFLEAYDTIAAAIASSPSLGALTLPAIGFGNLFTGVSGFAARMIPAERFLFELTGRFATSLTTMFNLFSNSDDPNIRKRLQDAEAKGGSVVGAFLTSPVRTLSRLDQFYDVLVQGDSAITKVAKGLESQAGQAIAKAAGISEARKRKSLLPLMEGFEESPDEEEDEESFEEIDLSEFSGVSALGGVPVLPLGKTTKKKKDNKHIRLYEKEKQIKEQREAIRRLQLFHQKTTNRLK